MNAVIKIFFFICNLIVIPINMSKAATFSEVIAPITKHNKAFNTNMKLLAKLLVLLRPKLLMRPLAVGLNWQNSGVLVSVWCFEVGQGFDSQQF